MFCLFKSSPDTLHHIYPDISNPIIISEFAILLKENSESIACKIQMYFPSHKMTCYKYNIHKSKVCRFEFLRSILLELQIDLNRTIYLYQDNIWINPWNQAFTSLIQSNHDINFILSSIKILTFKHYITNYATKGNCS